MSNLNQNILDVVKDAEFAKRVSGLKTPEEVQAAFKEKGVDITLQDVDVIAAAIKQKLEDDAIGSVAGGCGMDLVWTKGTDAKMVETNDDMAGKTAGVDYFIHDEKNYILKQGEAGHLTTAGKIGASIGGIATAALAGYGLYETAKKIHQMVKGNSNSSKEKIV